jgi:adenylate cyclase
LIHQDGTSKGLGLALLAAVRESSARERLSMTVLPPIDTYLARANAHEGDLDGAIELSRRVVEGQYRTGSMLYLGMSVQTLAELLLRRGETDDLAAAAAAIDRLSRVPTDAGFVLHDVPLLKLRALLARARGDDASYRSYAKDYAVLANSLGFEAHMAEASALSS